MLLSVGVGTAVTSASTGGTATVNEVTSRALLALPEASVTVIVQSEYDPSLSAVELSGCVKVTVLFVDVTADEVELPQAPPYVMVPVSLEEKV